MIYIIMDGRANYDPDEAQVIEAFEAPDTAAAVKYMQRNYAGQDVALVDENNELV